MFPLNNIVLMIYLALVSLIGTLGNGIILLAYGNRWSSSRSTSVVFILILACVDLWTCLIVVPTIAFAEYKEFDVPTLFCRFYTFSKILINISSLIMSFIAVDRFLNIALPHDRLINPFRVKCLSTFLILIGIVLGVFTALAFSSTPVEREYLINVTYLNAAHVQNHTVRRIRLAFGSENSTSLADLTRPIFDSLEIPVGANITNISLVYQATIKRCFADTSIISESNREILRHTSNKLFFISIGIVTILYTITFILALRQQNPRIRALKKSLHVLNQFDSQPSTHQSQRTNSLPLSYSVPREGTAAQVESTTLLVHDGQNNVDNSDATHALDSSTKQHESRVSLSEGTSDDIHTSIEKIHPTKRVSFQIQSIDEQGKPHLDASSTALATQSDAYYKLSCPCSTTRQLFIKFHFAQPTLSVNQWLCSCCPKRSPSSSPSLGDLQSSIIYSNDDEPSTVITSPPLMVTPVLSNSDALKKQLHRHRLKQIRMASTFLLITVSFVLFYLPSILSAEGYLTINLLINYLYLWTHALNPIIYCFMNVSLRAYVFSMLRCGPSPKRRSITGGAATIMDR